MARPPPGRVRTTTTLDRVNFTQACALESAPAARWLEEFGEAELIGGWAQVALDETFAELLDEDYQVFVSSYDPVQLFIQNRTRQSFEIHVLPAQPVRLRSPAHCAYHIVGRRSVKTPRGNEA